VVGFQTRNPMHRAHYELTQYALNRTGDSDAKLFLNPVVGETQSCDIDYHVRVHCYRKMLPKYKENTVLMGLLPLAMRMAGPREACLHALIRRNYGCTHFVVGRDHAGPSFKKANGESFYGPYDAQNLFFKHANEIGIKPIVSKMIVYNSSKDLYQAIDTVPVGDNVLKLSGTEVRKRLRSGDEIPVWFSYPEIVEILRKGNKTRGTCYYFVGLSASGKTTFANMLKARLLEADIGREITVLDGDIVRTNLSRGLGFSKIDRSTNVRRIGFVASEIVKHGGTVICANIAPYDEDRLANRKLIESTGGRYVEIWVNTPLEVCETRDVKGLYKLAREGKIKQFTGISDPFEEPSRCDVKTWENSKCMEMGCLNM
jgi:sulfate adenylyltransferase